MHTKYPRSVSAGIIVFIPFFNAYIKVKNGGVVLMKEKFFKICTGAVVFSLLLFSVGCGEEEISETLPSVSENETFFNSPQTNETFSEESETTELQTEPAAEAANVIQKSESKQSLVDLYNRSISENNFKRISMSQKTHSGTINLGGQKIDLSEEKNKGLREQTQTADNSKSSCPLMEISADNVETAEKINNCIVFRLKNYSSGIDISQGAGNYHGIVEKKRTEEILNNAVKYLKLPGTVSVKSGEYSLSDGVITAYFEKDFTSLKKITFSGMEDVSGKVNYLIIKAKINISFSLSSCYEA